MDYIAPIVAEDAAEQGLYFMSKIGPYDVWAIKYGYSEFDPNLTVGRPAPEREREREREKEKEREREIWRERQRQRQRERKRESGKEKERERERGALWGLTKCQSPIRDAGGARVQDIRTSHDVTRSIKRVSVRSFYTTRVYFVPESANLRPSSYRLSRGVGRRATLRALGRRGRGRARQSARATAALREKERERERERDVCRERGPVPFPFVFLKNVRAGARRRRGRGGLERPARARLRPDVGPDGVLRGVNLGAICNSVGV